MERGRSQRKCRNPALCRARRHRCNRWQERFSRQHSEPASIRRCRRAATITAPIGRGRAGGSGRIGRGWQARCVAAPSSETGTGRFGQTNHILSATGSPGARGRRGVPGYGQRQRCQDEFGPRSFEPPGLPGRIWRSKIRWWRAPGRCPWRRR